MRLSRKKLLSMIEEEAERTERLSDLKVENVKEPLTLKEIDMLDLLLTRADLYGSIPNGHDPDVFGRALDAASDLYTSTETSVAGQQVPPNAPGASTPIVGNDQ